MKKIQGNVGKSNGVTNLTLPIELTEPVLQGSGLDCKIENGFWRLTPNSDNKRNVGTISAGPGRTVSAAGVKSGRRFQFYGLPVPDFEARVVDLEANGKDLILRIETGVTFEQQLKHLMS
jgi:hypothetical protein